MDKHPNAMPLPCLNAHNKRFLIVNALSSALKKEVVLVGAILGHCELLQSLVDISSGGVFPLLDTGITMDIKTSGRGHRSLL